MFRRACSWPGCAALVDRATKFCQRHAGRGEQLQAHAVRLYDQFSRSPEMVAFYHSAAWLAIRELVLTEQPICDDCGRRFSHHVDHRQPIRTHWELRLDRANLHGLCQPCHNTKTKAEQKGAL